MDETKTVTLRKPVKLGEVQYTTLNLREPTAGDLAQAMKGANDIEVAINLISLVSATPAAAVRLISQRDLKECSDFLGKFSEGSPPTG